jgi:hypothetical protein
MHRTASALGALRTELLRCDSAQLLSKAHRLRKFVPGKWNAVRNRIPGCPYDLDLISEHIEKAPALS